MNQAKVHECDDELSKQANGDNYFVDWEQEGKHHMRTFKTEQQAEMFAAGYNVGLELKEKHECHFCKRELTKETWNVRLAWNPDKQEPADYHIYTCGDKKGCDQE